ncbi:MAG: hypothetical protein FWC38_05830 [Proteobacteria bacterium]|nr:hypothetical protein [Pseudomonadota bacterium]
MKMKRNLFACLLLSLFLTACGGDGGSGSTPPVTPEPPGGGDGTQKLLVRVVTEGGGERTFRYDDKNRLIADSGLGEGGKIEYEGDDARPSLVTNGVLPYIPYYRYQYGEDDLLGEPMKYYQTQSLNQNGNPYGAEFSFSRHYLNADDREIAYGYYDASSNQFSPSRLPSDYSYDGRGNVLKWSRTIGAHGAYMRETV